MPVQMGNTIAMPTANNTTGGYQRESAVGFVNFYLPRKNGKRFKIGAIDLKASKANEAKLDEMFNSGELTVEKFLSLLQCDYNPNVKATESDLDFEGTVAQESPF